jgi:hypothetical protein
MAVFDSQRVLTMYVKPNVSWGAGVASITAVALLALAVSRTVAGQGQLASAVRIDPDDIGGVVTNGAGPEAGVWVIAETNDLPTKYAKIVATDDRGRYLLPDLPTATYNVWVRGYGLVDSPKVKAGPGRILNLTAVTAPSAAAAAQYYPANYWLSLLHPPPKSDFPGTGRTGNGIPEANKTQADWIANLKMNNSCTQCHQMGNKATREIPANLGTFKSSTEAWDTRVQIGQSGAFMSSGLAPLGRTRALTVFADWTDRIAKGELPPVPPRPKGLERNVVITLWDWADDKSYVHDLVATDKRHPTLNANGPIYGAQEHSGDWMTILDPIRNTATRVPVPTKNPPPPIETTYANVQVPSPTWGSDINWAARSSPHTPMMDEKGRVWITAYTHDRSQPDYCKEGSSLPSAKLMPLQGSGRNVVMYDPQTKQFSPMTTCFGTHHLMFGEDPNSTIWFNGARRRMVQHEDLGPDSR